MRYFVPVTMHNTGYFSHEFYQRKDLMLLVVEELCFE